ncbi:hypothetical protein B0H11DRAFT_2216856 [Mycena galericulata]|nr:hypothetical protein B0H11DRAFT_2258660 [Mycena galericulata]KAJ7509186.1 hypothetical protein B0H11DRAFT_2216856 [Mycena galericulata]
MAVAEPTSLPVYLLPPSLLPPPVMSQDIETDQRDFSYHQFPNFLRPPSPQFQSQFNSEKKKIPFTLSLLGRADRNWRRRKLSHGTLSLTYTFAELIEELEQTSKDQNIKQTAHMRLIRSGVTEWPRLSLPDTRDHLFIGS